jgi:hypothetical protein
MTERYPGYDVLAKRDTPSWNEQTRKVVDDRLATPREPRFLTAPEFSTLDAVCARIMPQPPDRPPVPLAAMVDDRLVKDRGDGYRNHRLPPLREAWQRGLAALDVEAVARHGARFSTLGPTEQDALLAAAQRGELNDPAWHGMPSKLFFSERVPADILGAYYAHPPAWSEIGFGGPASPRGYVRMGADRRDPWEAVEARGDG